MMKTRVLILLVALSLFAVACDLEPETSTTSEVTTPSQPSTTEGSSSTTVGAQIDLPPIPAGTVCFYLAGYVAVEPGQVTNAETMLNDGGISANETSPDSILEATSDPAEPAPPNVTEINETILTAVEYLQVNDDPLQVSLALRNLGIQASPIQVLGFTTHIKFQPGTDSSPVPDQELPDVSVELLDEDKIAVVDSGIVFMEDGNPAWFYGEDDAGTNFVTYEDLDFEELTAENPASHGTFVTGLIRQISPSKPVTFAAARTVNPQMIVATGNEPLPPGVPTAEIQVAEALARLQLREADSAITALNLSLGSYVCDTATDLDVASDPTLHLGTANDLVTMTGMMTQWLETFEGSTIMAAAGNENYKLMSANGSTAFVPFYPAGLSVVDDRIHAVAAMNPGGDEVVWVDKEPLVVGSNDRSWVTDQAPGADLVNLGGGVVNGMPALVCWSGSSFATAIATAQLTLGISPSTADYGQVDGLSFVDTRTSESALTIAGAGTEAGSACDHDSET